MRIPYVKKTTTTIEDWKNSVVEFGYADDNKNIKKQFQATSDIYEGYEAAVAMHPELEPIYSTVPDEMFNEEMYDFPIAVVSEYESYEKMNSKARVEKVFESLGETLKDAYGSCRYACIYFLPHKKDVAAMIDYAKTTNLAITIGALTANGAVVDVKGNGLDIKACFFIVGRDLCTACMTNDLPTECKHETRLLS